MRNKFDGPVKSHNDTNVCHSRESGNPLFQILTSSWIPAFAGMTTNYECIKFDGLVKTMKPKFYNFTILK